MEEEYIQNLKNYLVEFDKLPIAKKKITALLEADNCYKKGNIPTKSLPNLEFTETEILEHLTEFPNIMELESHLLDFREYIIEEYGIWHIYSQEWLQDLKAFLADEQTLMIMAGNAVLGKFLKNIICTDNLDWRHQDNERPNPWTKIEQLDALEAVKKYLNNVSNIIIEWCPDSTDTDIKVLHYLRQKKWKGNLIVVGEKLGATNSKAFWEEAHLERPVDLNRHHKPFDFIKDQVYLAK